MRVLYFHQYFTTRDGASGTRSYEFARRLLARGHQVTMVCARSDGSDWSPPEETGQRVRRRRVDGIQVIQFDLPYSNHMPLSRRAYMFLRFALSSIGVALRADYDLVFATSTPLTVALPGLAARYLRGKPFVFEVRDLWPELPRAMGVVKSRTVLAALASLEWLSYRAASACVGLSPGIADGIARRSPPGRGIAMIPNASDLDLFKPGRRADLRLPGVRPNDCVALFTGAHGIANGLDAVLDAAAVLRQRRRNDIVLAFIGDGRCKPALMERARRENLGNCRFYEPMPKAELSHVVGCADIGLMVLADVPAFYDGTSPNKFFDYISAGLPVVNNYPGWLADLIRQHRCGEVVPPHQPGAFADSLCRLADDPKWREKCRQNARALAEARFSRDRLADEFVDWLEKTHAGRVPAGWWWSAL